MFNIILIILAIIAAVLFYASTRPDTFKVERSISINATSEKIFPLINDLHLWEDWTPYNKDPAMKKTYSGSASGKGAKYAWEGNSKVGSGEISITESTAPSEIVFDLHMIKPFDCSNVVVFSLHEAQGITQVTWSMSGKANFVSKVMGLFMNMDKMVGGDFETGLNKLKLLAEKN